MKPLERIFETARANRRHILLSEGEDPRIQKATVEAMRAGLADISLLGDRGIIEAGLRESGGNPEDVRIVDPSTAGDAAELADVYYELRRHKGVTRDAALDQMRMPLGYAAMSVRLGKADGTVGGAVETTANTVRAALQIIGKAPGLDTVSSSFLMLSCAPQSPVKGGMIFSDCGLVVEPTAVELASIARASAKSCRLLLGEEPRVALLSFSTAGSAQHGSLGKIREALEIVRTEEPGLLIDGEMQFDAALDEQIRAKKAPQSSLRGRPNVFVFPDLASGNIGYKIAQRLGSLTAVGPILQGLALPANDLSRGSTVDDILATIAVTALQSLDTPAAARVTAAS